MVLGEKSLQKCYIHHVHFTIIVLWKNFEKKKERFMYGIDPIYPNQCDRLHIVESRCRKYEPLQLDMETLTVTFFPIKKVNDEINICFKSSWCQNNFA